MSDTLLLDPDLRDAARLLIASGRIRAELDPEQYRTAVRGHAALARFFRVELNWTLEVHEVAEVVRLHKRRADVPGDRGPLLPRERQELAPALVMVLVCLVCEQLWRRPRMSLRELLQAVAQVCAAEAPSGDLPQFRIVLGEGTGKKEARENRQSLADALKILAAEGTITVDADLDRALADDDSDLVVTASRERLATRFSSLSPTLLGLDDLPPEQHAAALSAELLLDYAPHSPAPTAPTVEQRRLQAVRRLVDDPAADPLDDDTEATAYLHTLAGRERALNVTAALGLATTVRRNWWQTTDPTGLGSGNDFPNGRRTERQAALALLAVLPGREEPAATTLPLEEIIELFSRAREIQPRWAAAYKHSMPSLARAAAAELVGVALLTTVPGRSDLWKPTPGVHLWRIRVHQPPAMATTTAEPVASSMLVSEQFPDVPAAPDPGRSHASNHHASQGDGS